MSQEWDYWDLSCGDCGNKAIFASCVILVEGPTERAALPIYAKHLSIDFNDLGISVVNANGKENLDSLFHLYSSIDIPVFTVFDNDRGARQEISG